MLSILNRSFLSDLNEFLTNFTQNQRWMIYEDVSDQPDFDDNLRDMPIKFWIVNTLRTLRVFEEQISVNRDFQLEWFYKYANEACSFDNFRIGKFDWENQNDHNETKWFDNYLQSTRGVLGYPAHREFLSAIGRYNMLVAYTTTTLNNHRYMISNYSRDGKQCIAYKGGQVIDSYDSMYSSKIKPIRGFVRYNANGKEGFMRYIQAVYRFTGDNKYLKFMMMISSVFIKGNCMAEEAEYRFMVITTNSFQALELECVTEMCHRFSCALHNENPYYVTDTEVCDIQDGANRRCSQCIAR